MLKNSKYKNTGFLYDILVRQITNDLLNENENNSYKVINKFFNVNGSLTKELGLYKMLIDEQFSSEIRALRFIDSVVKSRKKLNDKSLSGSRYKLVKEIKNSYDIDTLFKTRLSDYKLYSSIYKLFEYDESEDPVDISKAKDYVLNHLLRKNENPTKESKISEEVSKYFNGVDSDTQQIAYKMAVDKFNKKYNSLLEDQKDILKNYILNSVNSDDYLQFFTDKYSKLKKVYEGLKISDKSVSIKLDKIDDLLSENFEDIKFISNKHILLLMKYTELIDELK